MIIGVSGHINSGKDLIGKIIQYLVYMSKDVKDRYYPYDVFIDELNIVDLSYESNWQIKKFADKLKDIVCLLIGCTREQLEDREFKNTPLGEEWDKYYIFGSNTVDKKTIIERYKEEFSTLPSEYWLNSQKLQLTPRLLLQLLGTEIGRNIIHPNIWVNALMSEYKCIDRRTMQDPDDSNISYPKWIITDVRFPNEVEAIKERNGIIIRLNRFIQPNCKACNMKDVKEEDCNSCIYHEEILDSIHESETALDDYTGFNYTIDNNGTIESLIDKVKEILIKEKIL